MLPFMIPTKINRNHINNLKIEVNKLISHINKHNSIKILNPIIGEFSPGYIYGAVKIRKDGNPLRPIISQIPTPIYELPKQLNNIISPYIPAKYIINSTDDFVSILRVLRPSAVVASLDVESLFTNVPVMETIDIICNNVYNRPTLFCPPLTSPVPISANSC